MTVPDAYKDLLQLLSLPDPATAPTFARDHVLNEMNAALQQVQSAGEDFYGREELTIDLVAGESDYELTKAVQTVLDGVQLTDGTQLRKLTSRGQFRHYGTIFAGQLEDAMADDMPEAYWVESLKDLTSGVDDTVKIIVHLAPAPDVDAATLNLFVPVIKEPTAIATADLSDNTKKIAIPHKYVESVFLPLVRYNLISYFLFTNQDQVPVLEAAYERALNLLGIADPRKPKPIGESNDAALRLPEKQPAAAAQ